MARLFGVNIPDEKKVKISLTYIFGIGRKRAMDILEATKIDPEKRTKDLTEEELARIRSYIEANYKVEGALRQEIRDNINRLKEIRCYRGIRHIIGLPVRGQRTRRNARTWKGKAIPVGGLNPKVSKK